MTDKAKAIPKKHDSASLIKRLMHEHIRPYLGRIFISLLFMTIAAGATAALAKFLQPVIDTIFMEKQLTMLFPIGLGVLAIFAVKGLASYGESISMNYVGQKIVSDIQKRLFAHFMAADLAHLQGLQTGAIISRFTNDVWLLRNAVSNTLTGIGKDFLTLIFLVTLMFYQDWKLASIAFFVFPLAILPIIRIGKKMRRLSTTSQQENAEWTILLEQVFQGARLVRAYGMEKYEIGRASSVIDTLFRINQKSCRTRSASHPIMETLGGLAVVAVILYGGYQVIQGTHSTGAFVSFIGALLLAYEPMKRLAHLNSNLQEGLAAAARLFRDLDIAPAITDTPQAKPLATVKGEITFDAVSFAYDLAKGEVLKNLSFTIPQGQKLALVGPSGGGKSTLLNLIPRFYEVTKGRILIDGHPIINLTLASLRQHIALVSQEITLFDDTIAANIAYGNLSASTEEIETAARNAAAHDFIIALPDGYNTRVGEGGLRLSGGQRQRIAIARAMLKNAPILLLDEATSALDADSERQVQDALRRLMQGRTSIVIAHRFSTILDADCIFVIDKGNVREQGTHEELLRAKGLYARLAKKQSTEAYGII